MGNPKPLIVGNIGKDINLKTFKGSTTISIEHVNGVPLGEVQFKIPTNLRAIVENTTKRIEECEKIVDELIIPSLVETDYKRTVMEFDFNSRREGFDD